MHHLKRVTLLKSSRSRCQHEACYLLQNLKYPLGLTARGRTKLFRLRTRCLDSSTQFQAYGWTNRGAHSNAWNRFLNNISEQFRTATRYLRFMEPPINCMYRMDDQIKCRTVHMEKLCKSHIPSHGSSDADQTCRFFGTLELPHQYSPPIPSFELPL